MIQGEVENNCLKVLLRTFILTSKTPKLHYKYIYKTIFCQLTQILDIWFTENYSSGFR